MEVEQKYNLIVSEDILPQDNVSLSDESTAAISSLHALSSAVNRARAERGSVNDMQDVIIHEYERLQSYVPAGGSRTLSTTAPKEMDLFGATWRVSKGAVGEITSQMRIGFTNALFTLLLFSSAPLQALETLAQSRRDMKNGALARCEYLDTLNIPRLRVMSAFDGLKRSSEPALNVLFHAAIVTEDAVVSVAESSGAEGAIYRDCMSGIFGKLLDSVSNQSMEVLAMGGEFSDVAAGEVFESISLVRRTPISELRELAQVDMA